MKLLVTAAITAGLVLLAGCGKQESEQAATTAPPAASGAEPAAMSEPMAEVKEAVTAAADGATQTIDHARDEIEFQLKRSLAGLESLREDIADSEQVAAIEEQIAEIKAKLEKM